MERLENLKVKGHRGTWYVIDSKMHKGQMVYLLESEQYGEDAACIIVNENLEILEEDVYNGFDDLDY